MSRTLVELLPLRSSTRCPAITSCVRPTLNPHERQNGVTRGRQPRSSGIAAVYARHRAPPFNCHAGVVTVNVFHMRMT